MKADTLTPSRIFSESGIREVPLFQRKYVWSKERQWQPLWNDLARLTNALLLGGPEPAKHFMGAVVLQQLPKRTGALQRTSIIDGQQRLTTLQILFDAIRKEAVRVDVPRVVSRMETLLVNPELEQEGDPVTRFKLHPTNKDQEAFFELIGSESPRYKEVKDPAHRLVKAHEFFSESCAEWLADKANPAEAIEKLSDTIRELLSIAVIDLEPNENAQEIFETLNARGTPLSAADLIKNFVFQRIREESPDSIQKVYSDHWLFFETEFWESKVAVAGNQMNRTSVFFGQWLIAKTEEEVASRDIFYRFKRFVTESTNTRTVEILQNIHRVAEAYEKAATEALTKVGDLSPMGHFIYRTQAIKVDSATPVLIAMISHDQGLPDNATLRQTLNILESWLVRRMLMKLPSKNYPGLMVKLVKLVNDTNPQELPAVFQRELTEQTEALAWPGDQALREWISHMPIYRKLSRSRLRMVLEAIEDHLLGWGTEKGTYQETRVKRHSFHIEHLMPQEWSKHWPLPEETDEAERDASVQLLGNLTLLPQRLNSKVSNGPWAGDGGKVENIRKHDNLIINRTLLRQYDDFWSEGEIDSRTTALTEIIAEIWPVPEGHAPLAIREQKPASGSARIDLADLMSAGFIEGGATIYPRSEKFADSRATINSEGAIELGGQKFDSLSAAAKHLTGRPTNGWWWWTIEVGSDQQELREIRQEYLDAQGCDDTEDDEEG